MPYTVLVHIQNEESVLGEIERMPEPTDQILAVSNPRYRDGRNVTYLQPDIDLVLYPWAHLHCVEVMYSDTDEEVVSFIRE
jgi:hypothetical protein